MATVSESRVRDAQKLAMGIPRLYWYFTFFIISGFCGLVYEVVWVRLAMASFGVTTALVSIVLSMFMAGLGLGSWGAGKFARRDFRSASCIMLRLYAATELLIGVSSVTVPLLLKAGRNLMLHATSFGGWQTSGYYVLAGLWIAVTLLPWCTCMGATFPFLMAVIRHTDADDSKHSFSYLYIANVLGALLGTFISAYILIEFLGFQGTLYVAGALNTLLAATAFALSSRVASVLPAEISVTSPAPRATLYGLPRKAILFFLFTTGLVSMGMEVVWIRQLTPYLGNVVYAFAGILAVYLLSTNVGSFDYRSNARKRGPEESASSWTLLAFFSLMPVIAVDPILGFGRLHVGGGAPLSSIVFFCAIVGYLTPLLVDCWSEGDPDKAGTAYAVNIAGCILGPLIAGFWLLPWLGERLSIGALALPLFVIAALAVFHKPIEALDAKANGNAKLKFLIAAVLAVVIIAVSHDFGTQFAQKLVRRDYTATVIATGTGFDRQILVNGIGMTRLTPITKYIAHLPLAYMSRPPRNGLVICFGMGTSFRSMMSWGIPTTAVDLVPSVPKMFPYFFSDASELERSPRAHIVIDDGRRFLDGSTQKYDVIVVDPPPPVQAAGSSLLYSREFYAVIRKHLSADGKFLIWYPAGMGDVDTSVSVTKALADSFPYKKAYASFDPRTTILGVYYLASMSPLPDTPSSVLASRMPPAAAADFVEWGPATTAQKQFDLVLSREVPLQALINQNPQVPEMSDDRPVNEYYLLRDYLHTRQ
ncbi:MAG TPA: fused MFS/spermidine synthase [Terracidiphilus sp.]|nr:fused MFS/spermidine synthase [Terracidiphilus sp.]